MKMPTRQVVLEGCDLTGKSTLYSKLHKATKFRYDIRDRGRLSRVVYSTMYDRNLSHETAEFYRFLDDLNNRIVLLSLPWDLVSARYDVRGDELHDRGSLLRTWNEFNGHVLALTGHPSLLIRGSEADPSEIAVTIDASETVTTAEVADRACRALESTGRNESLDLHFELLVDPEDDPGPSSLEVPGEEAYYESIHKELLERVESEISGGQSETSRRFVAANPSCITYVRFIRRSDSDVVDLICRSTNVPKNLKIDLDAIIHSCFKVQDILGHRQRFTLRVRLHCAHIVP
jgi:hypothetical protein